MARDKLTKEDVIELHLAYTGSQPGKDYDWRHVGGPLEQAIKDFKKLPRPVDPEGVKYRTVKKVLKELLS